MLEQIKDLCFFMICGQTLLYFQSGKKYEKICRMILELLVLAGIVGMILNFLQSLGFQKGEMAAAGGAVAGMQRSMEEALSKQLGAEGMEEDFLSGDILGNLVERHTMEEIKSRYNYFAQKYGFEIQSVEMQEEKVRVLLKKTGEAEETEIWDEAEDAGNSAKIAGIEQIEIAEIKWNENEKNNGDIKEENRHSEKDRTEEKDLEKFRRQLALVLEMEEEKLEVILIG